jgi:hypothetical protein
MNPVKALTPVERRRNNFPTEMRKPTDCKMIFQILKEILENLIKIPDVKNNSNLYSLALSCPSVCLHLPAHLPLDGLS